MRRTKLFAAVIFLMLYAKLSVTLIAKPSGTATTIIVTAIMKYSRKFLPTSAGSQLSAPVGVMPNIAPMNVPTARTPAPMPTVASQPRKLSFSSHAGG